jgi:hypothetical protein
MLCSLVEKSRFVAEFTGFGATTILGHPYLSKVSEVVHAVFRSSDYLPPWLVSRHIFDGVHHFPSLRVYGIGVNFSVLIIRSDIFATAQETSIEAAGLCIGSGESARH